MHFWVLLKNTRSQKPRLNFFKKLVFKLSLLIQNCMFFFFFFVNNFKHTHNKTSAVFILLTVSEKASVNNILFNCYDLSSTVWVSDNAIPELVSDFRSDCSDSKEPVQDRKFRRYLQVPGIHCKFPDWTFVLIQCNSWVFSISILSFIWIYWDCF